MSTRRTRAAVAAACAAALLATATAATAAQAARPAHVAAGGTDATLTVALPTDPTYIHPDGTNQRDLNLAAAVNEKLLEFSVDGDSFDMILAESVEQIDDTTVEIVLKQGITFTNGEPFDAASAAYSLETTINLEGYQSFVAVLDGVEVIDDYTVHVTSDSPNPLMITALALVSYQFPKDYHAEVGHEAFGQAPIGTGPYVFEEWNRGASIRYSANPDYREGAAPFGTLEFQIVPDPAAQIAALESGQVDLVLGLPTTSVSQIEGSGVARVESRPSNRIYYATLTTLEESPLQDPAVRRALQHAIDVESIVEIALGGYGTPLTGQLLTPAFQGFDPDRQATPYDPELARQLLAEAGYPDGFSIPLLYSQTNLPPVGDLIAQQLGDVGITAEQNLMEPGTFLTDLTDRKLSGIFYAGSLPPPDASFMYAQFQSEFRYSYYSNPEIDELLAAQQETADPEARQAILAEMLAVFDEDPAFIPLFQGEDLYGVSNDVTGFVPRASQWINFYEFAPSS